MSWFRNGAPDLTTSDKDYLLYIEVLNPYFNCWAADNSWYSVNFRRGRVKIRKYRDYLSPTKGSRKATKFFLVDRISDVNNVSDNVSQCERLIYEKISIHAIFRPNWLHL